MRTFMPLLVALVLAFGWNSASAASSRHHNYAADSQTVYMSTRASLAHLRFHITSGSMSEGVIEAYRVTDGPGGSRRLTLNVRIRDGLGGGSDLVLQMSEVAADASGNPVPSAKAGSPTDKSIADSIFQDVENQLGNMRR